MNAAERQQQANHLRAERAARHYAAQLSAADPVKWAGAIATALGHADRHAADAALVGQRRESPL